MDSQFLKAVEDQGSNTFTIQKETVVTTLNGSQIKYTKADRTDLSNRPYGNLFSSFNLPITNDQKAEFTTNGGLFYGTSFSGINQDKVIIIEIPKDTYGELIDGKTMSVTLPLTGGSINLFGTYLSNSNENLSSGNSRLTDATNYAGYFGINPNVDNSFNSNIVFLYSNTISTPKTNSGTTWNQWTNANKYDKNNPNTSTTAKQFADPILDTPVAIGYLDKGFVVVFNQTLVNQFNYSSGFSSGYDNIPSGATYSGNTNFTQIYFTGSSSNMNFNSILTEYVQNLYCIAGNSEFFESTNPTFQDVYQDGNIDGDPVYITSIGFYNSLGECIAIGKTSAPIPKNKNNTLTFSVQLKV